MKNIKHIFSAGLLLCMLFMEACTSDFEEINTDLNNPTTVAPSLLLPNAIQITADRYWGHVTRYERLNIDAAMCWVQHISRNIYINAEGDAYEIPITVSSGTWNNMYHGALVNFESIMKLSAPDAAYENTNYTGVAMVMKAFAFSFLTDVFGPIPYSNALNGTADEPIYTPGYDSMEEIYAGLLEELETANNLLQVNGPAIDGDILFNGDVLRWKKFANSLRLRLANHQAAKKPEISQAIMTTILADPATYPVFTNNNDFAALQHSAIIGSGSTNKMFDVFSNRSDWNVSSTLVDRLLALDDERLTVYASPLADGTYAGLPNGLADAAVSDFNPSTIGQKFFEPDAPSIFMSYAELLFIKAEAAFEGLVPGDAAALLEEAISASFEQHDLSMPADYMSRVGTVDKEAIMTQKWIALFGQGVEAWTEYRRTGYPVMPNPHPSAIFANDGILPTRLVYPPTEYSLNEAAVTAGLELLGSGDNMRARLWWVE